MNRREVRIGNFVFTNKIHENVHQILPHDFYNNRIEGYIPIPLTDDILLKSGFGRELIAPVNVQYWLNKEHEVWLYSNRTFPGVYWLGGYASKTQKIQFVHLLQNIMFVLTGEEPIIKL